MQFYLPDCQEFQDFSTVQDNSRSYQGFQEVTGICGKMKDLGKIFKIFYTGSCKTNSNFVYKYFAVVRTTSHTIII